MNGNNTKNNGLKNLVTAIDDRPQGKMKKYKTSSDVIGEPQKKGEFQRAEKNTCSPPLSIEETNKLIQTLRVHQAELETQNGELHQTRIVLEKLLNRFRDLFYSAPVGYLTLNKEGMILEANLKMEEMLGVERSCFLKQPLSAFIAPADRDAYERYRTKLFGSGSRQTAELKIIKNDGTSLDVQLEGIVNLEFDGDLGQSRICIIDISRRIQIEENLKRSETALKGILQAAPIGIGLVRNRVIQWVSDYLCQMLGYNSKNELIGQSARVFYNSDEEFERVGRVKYGQIRNTGSGSIDTVFVRKDGKSLNIHLSSVSLSHDKVQSSETIFTAMDITERKQIQERLQRASDAMGKKIVERTQELHEANIALTVLLKLRDEEKKELQKNIVHNVRELILPNLEKMKLGNSSKLTFLYANIIKENLEQITGSFGQNMKSIPKSISPRELHVAELIRQGKTTKEISLLMGLSTKTIETYRDNLRKKLDLKNRKINLKTYLASLNCTTFNNE